MKTFEQCCDEVAQQEHFPSDFRDARIHKQAADLYAADKVKEAVRLARERTRIALRYTHQEILEKLNLKP